MSKQIRESQLINFKFIFKSLVKLASYLTNLYKVQPQQPMKSEYFFVYHNFDLIQDNLKRKLDALFSTDISQTPMSYQQILVYLDQQCQKFTNDQKKQLLSLSQNSHLHQSSAVRAAQSNKLFYRADRNISKEIFDNCIKVKLQNTTIKEFIERYIELLETSKLCLIREQAKQLILQDRLRKAQRITRSKTYVYVKLIQVTVHSRYSDSPYFQYKIVPSDIPPVTVVNSLNPVLNHQYTLEMDENKFSILFYESGITIYEWKFSVQQLNHEGEYFNSIATQPVTFEVKVKLLPKNKSQEAKQLENELKKISTTVEIAKKAFQNLCYYLPFQKQTEPVSDEIIEKRGFFWNFTNSLLSFLPFLRFHLLFLNYVLIFLIFLECLATVSWALQFIDLIILFGLLGALHDREIENVSMILCVSLLGLLLCTIKTVWGIFLIPFGMPRFPLVLSVAFIFKLISLFFIWMCIIRAEQIPDQRIRDLYGIKSEQNIYQKEDDFPIFKTNKNFHLNKNQIQKI